MAVFCSPKNLSLFAFFLLLLLVLLLFFETNAAPSEGAGTVVPLSVGSLQDDLPAASTDEQEATPQEEGEGEEEDGMTSVLPTSSLEEESFARDEEGSYEEGSVEEEEGQNGSEEQTLSGEEEEVDINDEFGGDDEWGFSELEGFITE
eukprot:GHVS01055436.1.p1 GENE.GHVS01055436.1~~GHVS01055436.1.p1  ORF type:complete len:148 (+),score=57.92 GHVS01055436.1:134-577(+)